LQGVFYWAATSLALDDGVNFIKPTASGDEGVWVRIETVQTAVVVIPSFPIAPISPLLFQIYWDTTLGFPRIWNGASWNGFRLT
jgi:hypothetical protein